MTTQKRWLLSILTILAFVLVACGGDTPGSNTVSTTDNDSPRPTAASADDTLGAMIESTLLGGKVSYEYPDGWFTEESQGSILVTNDESISIADPSTQAEIPSGTVMIVLSVIPDNTLTSLGNSPTPADVLDLFNSFNVSADAPEFGDAVELTINGNTAAEMSATLDDATSVLYAVDKTDYFVLGIVSTREEDAASNRQVTQEIIGSVVFTPNE